MRKVTPVISACNAFKSTITPINKRKKVKFDLATVSFQVDYDIPDDRIVRRKIPVWTEHWRKSKTNMILSLLRSVSLQQWIQFMILFICFFGLSVQLMHAFQQYLSYETIITAQYELPKTFQFPAITVCLPIIIPFSAGEKCENNDHNQYNNSSVKEQKCQQMTVSDIFNTSLSEWGHRCKFSASVSSSASVISPCSSVSPPLQWIHRNRKCFTYFSQLSKTNVKQERQTFSMDFAKSSVINVQILQSDRNQLQFSSTPEILLHESNVIPLNFDKFFEFISLNINRKYEIKYRLTRIHSIESRFLHKCHNYSNNRALLRNDISFSDCVSKCILSLMRTECGGCVSRLATIRRDLVESGQKLCLKSDKKCSQQQYNKIEEQCEQSNHCIRDCVQESYDLSVSEQISGDTSEANVTIRRKLSPDLVISHLPTMSCVSFVALLGGLIAFWLLLLWFCFTLIKVFKYFWELIEIYYM